MLSFGVFGGRRVGMAMLVSLKCCQFQTTPRIKISNLATGPGPCMKGKMFAENNYSCKTSAFVGGTEV